MANLVIKENSKVQEERKGNSKRKMEKNPNLHKVSLVLNATGMDTLRKNVRIVLKAVFKIFFSFPSNFL